MDETNTTKVVDSVSKSEWSGLSGEVKATAFVLFLNTWLDADESIDDLSSSVLFRLKKKWNEYWIPSLEQPHCGDCTKVCAPCTRCAMETIIKTAKRIVNT